jgi:hypothetical protein
MDTFESCPRQYFHRYVANDAPYLETEATRWGTTVHTACEEFVKGESDTLTTVMLDDFRPALEHMRTFDCDYRNVETEWAFNHQAQMCDFKSPDVFLRGYTDFEAVKGPKAWVVDYKTGKRHSKFEQVELYALTIWMRFPDVKEVTAGYMWLKERDPVQFISFRTLTRDKDMKRIWDARVERYERIKKAHETDVWQAKPTGLCGWCSANFAGLCEYAKGGYRAK